MSPDAQKMTRIMALTLEGVCKKLQVENDLTDEQAGLALISAGLGFLGSVWSGQKLVAHLAGLTAAVAELHGLDLGANDVEPEHSIN